MRSISKKVLPLLVLFGAVASVQAQTITGTFTGTLTDPSGSVLPKAKVTATNTATNVQFSANTNDAGI